MPVYLMICYCLVNGAICGWCVFFNPDTPNPDRRHRKV